MHNAERFVIYQGIVLEHLDTICLAFAPPNDSGVHHAVSPRKQRSAASQSIDYSPFRPARHSIRMLPATRWWHLELLQSLGSLISTDLNAGPCGLERRKTGIFEAVIGRIMLQT